MSQVIAGITTSINGSITGPNDRPELREVLAEA
jgi:hypothetical protein